MDEDSRDQYHEFEELVHRLIEHSISRGGSGMAPGYGFRIIIVGGEIPIGRMSCPPQGGTITYEPSTEVYTSDSEVLVVTEIPGVEEEHLHLQVTGTTLRVMARGHECRYEAVVDLPQVDTGSMSHHLKNGVLEIRFKISVGEAVNEGNTHVPSPPPG